MRKRINAEIERRMRRHDLRKLTRRHRRDAPFVRVLATLAPEANPDDLRHHARRFLDYAHIQRSGRLAASRRGTAPGLAKLDKLDKQITRLEELVESLGQDERTALRDAAGTDIRVEVLSTLEGWRNRFGAARDSLALNPAMPTRNGAAPDLEAAGVARYAAALFTSLTGLAATRRTDHDSGEAYGPFLDFLAEVFRVLKIKASATHHAREFGKHR